MSRIERIAAQTLSEIRRADRIEDQYYNSMSGMPLNIDYFKYVYEDMSEMYLKNPLGYRIINAKTRYVLGDGIVYKAEDEKVQECIDEYWNMPDNKWDIKLESRINELGLYGEMIIIPTVTDNSARMTIKMVYPGLVAERGKEDVLDEDITFFKISGSDKLYKVIRYDSNKDMYDGDAFYFAINKLSQISYGVGDLFVTSDWLRMYDKSLYATMSRVGLILSFAWDVLMEGASAQEVKNRRREITNNPPTPGSVLVHNKSEVWNTLSPSLQGSDMAEIYRMLKGQCISAQGIPEFIFGLGGDTNFATARAMLTPFYQDIKSRQKTVEYIFRSQFDYLLSKKKEKGMLGKDTDCTYTIMMTDPDSEKMKDYADTISKFSLSLVTLESNGVIEHKDAQNVIALLFNVIGVDIDINSEIDKEKTYDKLSAAYKKYIRK